MPPLPIEAQDVAHAAELASAVTTLEQAREIAVDVEADSMHAFRARLCFVQLGTDRSIFLLDTLQPEVDPKALAALFADPARTKYFHAAGGDLSYLADAGVRVRGLFDTHRAATLLGWQKVGLADLARERLGVELKKEHQQADFAQRPLPPELREYIADDVRYLCEIGRQVREACAAADILEEVVLDCERLAEEAQARPAEGADFKPKLPRGQLKPKELALAEAIAAAVHQKRLAWAEAANVPMGRMLSNAAVVAIASKPPTSLKDLQKREGVRGPFVREHGEEVLELVKGLIEQSRRGELAVAAEPAGMKDPGRRKRTDVLSQWRKEKAAARKVTASVVLTNPLLESLAKQPPANIEALGQVPYFGEKRVRLYGEELVALLAAADS